MGSKGRVPLREFEGRALMPNYMNNNQLLRDQIVKERKKKNRFFLFFFSISMFIIIYSIIFDEMGIFKYLELKKDKIRIEKSIASLELETTYLQKNIDNIRHVPYYKEKKAREDLDMALPDEYIYKIQ
ncbi:MAG: septum formation initiator family protein [Nitrospirae bacterium]|nr:septum formation initiator family protein [Nitrospirota bacterium]